MSTFQNFQLPGKLLDALSRINYEKPTPIQEKAIPLALEGKDILGSAQTGTGKTASFIVPLLAQLFANKESQALVLAPTRELAMQIAAFAHKLLGTSNTVGSVLLIGGQSMPKQIQQLKSNPRLLIGTPGRINDHLQRKMLHPQKINFFVLDEADRMLDMGFSQELDAIVSYLPQKRQTLMFSATMAAPIEKLAKKYLKSPERIMIGCPKKVANNIKQEALYVSAEEKQEKLYEELKKREGNVIIFAKTKRGTEQLARKLQKENHDARFIHGDLTQNKRERTIKSFRNKQYRIMVATDVAARGLDIPHIEHVINYDLPQSPDDYIHRIGRTARAGASGSALCLVSPNDTKNWRAIRAYLGEKVEGEKHEKPKRNSRWKKQPNSRSSSFKKKRSEKSRF
jgi:superfamily II DNA/RNA helicase